ncbi:hypothetical protein IAD21_02416 [Abditibacteriota bacterium]|nr:hypothetical protein IAD21_02416 [Abditibacteriota bacterium]
MLRPLIILMLGFLGGVANVYAQEAPAAISLSTPPKARSTDDVLVEVARNAKINFMADATHFANDAAPVDLDSTRPLIQRLDELATRQKLAWLSQDQVVLFWMAPNPRQLVQKLAQGDTIHLILPELGKESEVATPIPVTGQVIRKDSFAAQNPSQKELLFQEVSKYFREKHAWDDATPGDAKEVRISDLPPALRAKLGAAVQKDVLRPDDLTIWNVWFTDQFWSNAQLRLIEQDNGNPKGPKIQVLAVTGSIQTKSMRGGSMISLGALKGLPKY